MNRRGFLGAIAGALTLDPERLLWRPGAKLISIPAPRISLVDFYESQRLNRELLRALERQLCFERSRDIEFLIGDRWPAAAAIRANAITFASQRINTRAPRSADGRTFQRGKPEARLSHLDGTGVSL